MVEPLELCARRLCLEEWLRRHAEGERAGQDAHFRPRGLQTTLARALNVLMRKRNILFAVHTSVNDAANLNSSFNRRVVRKESLGNVAPPFSFPHPLPVSRFLCAALPCCTSSQLAWRPPMKRITGALASLKSSPPSLFTREGGKKTKKVFQARRKWFDYSPLGEHTWDFLQSRADYSFT